MFVFSRQPSDMLRVPPRPGAQIVVDLGEFLLQWLQGFQQCEQSTLADRLDDEAGALLTQDGLILLQFELTGNAQGLIAAVAEQTDVTFGFSSLELNGLGA